MNKPALKLAAAWAATNIASGMKQQCIWIRDGDWIKKIISVIALVLHIFPIAPIRFFWVMRWAYVDLIDPNYKDYTLPWGHIKRFWKGGKF